MDFSSSSSSSLYKALATPPISGAGAAAAERERMFEKVVTPSDVGKLNRLVIPKQHAEKYFPLDAAAGEKGLLLSFEECRSAGKSWRFRYSYWSSSQSYVITKGWSRFVKDKKLDAGDVVSFFRSFGTTPAADDDECSVNGARLYIDWARRRRPDRSTATLQFHQGFSLNPWPTYAYSPAISPAPFMGLRSPFPPYHHYHHRPPAFEPPHPPPPLHFNHCQIGSFAGGLGPTSLELIPPKRLRLFGVNMDCTNDDDSVQDRNPNPDETATINFLGKGKSSSVSLDFGL